MMAAALRRGNRRFMGGFGSVFKGWIDEQSLAAAKPGTSTVIAVKRLNQVGLQGHQEWLAEINYLGLLNHPNLVQLIGYCLEDDHRLLVYESMPRGSLENHLFRRSSYFQSLSWNLRIKVALSAAKGLAYLHNPEAKVIYCDLKSSNILIDCMSCFMSSHQQSFELKNVEDFHIMLSAMKLNDGRIKVWIHVADAASFVQPGSLIDSDGGIPFSCASIEEQGVRADIAASFQSVTVLHLEERCERGIQWALEIEPSIKHLVVSGGVASNQYVKGRLHEVVERNCLQLVCPPPSLCTDNGVMIAWTGIENLRMGRFDPPPPAIEPEGCQLDLRPRWPLGEEYGRGRSVARSLRTARIHPSLTSLTQASQS